MRFVLAVAGGLFVVGGLYWILSAANGVQGFAGCTGTAAFGWIVPLVTGAVIGGVSWFLLHREEREPPEHSEFRRHPCPSCGAPVLDEWRLCPECGTVLDAAWGRTSQQSTS